MSRVVVHRLDRDAAVARLRQWASEELASHPEAVQAILIGSLARGDWSARSDADVVVIVDWATDPCRARAGRFAPAVSPGIGLDLFVYTDAERSVWGSRFREEVAQGEVLWAREGAAGRSSA